jgi:lipopolysaccharide biosynthesis glycosyltransferase
MARLFLLWDLESAWILYLDTDVVAVHPFLEELNSYLVRAPNAPIFAVLDLAVNCTHGTEVKQFYEGRQRITVYNRNKTPFLYYNSGFLVLRNCEMTKRMIRHVIEMTSKLGFGFDHADQDCLWAFTNTSLYGGLPNKFNCMEIRRLCPLNGCGPETWLFHSHFSPGAKQADWEFSKVFQNMTKEL